MYIKNVSKKNTTYSSSKLDSDLLFFIKINYNKNQPLKDNDIRLSNKKWEKIKEKHSLICGENLLEHVYENLPYYINKGYKERGLWLTKENEFIFISSDIGQNGQRVMFAIILNSYSQVIFIKSFYDIFNMSQKEKTFDKKHRRFTHKGIEQIISFSK